MRANSHKPIGKLVVMGRKDVQLMLDVYAETEWLAVTLEGVHGFAITHKPTGIGCYKNSGFGGSKASLKEDHSGGD